MSVIRTSPLVAAATLASSLSALSAQQGPPVRDLPKHSHEISEPYTLIAGVREAAGGKVIVVDAGDGELGRHAAALALSPP